MSEKFSNAGATTLNGAINNSVTSLIVNSAASFPTSGSFRLLIDSEIMLVTAVSSSTFTVTRAQEGTTGASHSSGTPVTHVLTSGALDAIRSEMNDYGAYGSRPAAAVPGKLYWPNDGDYIGRDDGSAWSQFAPMYKLTKPPAVASFSWVNQNTATAIDTDSGIYMKASASAGTNDMNILEVNAPATPYTVTAAWLPSYTTTDYSGLGICFRASGSGKIEPNQVLSLSGEFIIDNRRMDSPTAWNSDNNFFDLMPGSPMWLRMRDNGTTRFHDFSYDGITWNEYSNYGRTVFITADKVGFFIWNISQVPRGTLIHWAIT